MDVEQIRKLVRLMEDAGLTELEVEDRSGKIRLVRATGVPARSRGAEPEAAKGDDGSQPDADLDLADEARSWHVEEVERSGAATAAAGGAVVASPMVGTFYRAPAPDAEPFVAEGDVVHVGQVLCIIEAMKMMNEIHAEVAGRIVRIEAENGAAVEYGSPLFVVAPLD